MALPEAVFLDRDGVVNKHIDDLRRVEDVYLIDGSAQAIRLLNEKGIKCIIVTNQPGVAKGLFTLETLTKIHNRLRELLAAEGAHIDHIFFCPHHPEKGYKNEVAELKVDCLCRKPKPGMLIEAADKYRLDLSRCVLVGDTMSDIKAGLEAGCKTILVFTGKADKDKHPAVKPHHVCKDLLDACRLVLSGAC